MDVDKSGTTTHIIQKTTHMTLISHTKSDDGSIEGMFLFHTVVKIYFQIHDFLAILPTLTILIYVSCYVNVILISIYKKF